jgi:ATP-binding cassette subfamily B protein
MSQTLPHKPLAFALHATRPFWKWAVAAIIGVSAASVLDGMTNLLLKRLIDAITAAIAAGNGDFSRVRFWAIIFTVVFTGAGVTWRMSGLMAMRWFTRMKAASYKQLFSYLSYHSANYFSNRFAGSLTNKVSNVSEGTTNICQTIIWQLLPLTTFVIVGMYTAAVANIAFSLILIIWVAMYVTFNVFLVLKKRSRSVAVADAASGMRGAMVDSATNIAAVHQSGHHEHEIRYVQGYIETFRGATLRNWMFSEFILLGGNAMQGIFIGVMLAFSISYLQRGLITVGDVVLLWGLMMQVLRQIVFIGNEMNRFMDDYGSASEGLKELLIPHEITDIPGAGALEVSQGRIEFRGVDFVYGDKHVFRQLELVIPAGQKVGLVGHSGAGKTTLTAMLLRQYEIKDGAIVIDDQDIRKVSQRSLRRKIAIVPQDTSLFHRSIRDNIRYGNLNATDEDVIGAAKSAQAHEFILGLPQQYETLVGERGVKLSGGQRQRIAIARAILKDAPILVLDEATSALDSESEACIQKAFDVLMQKKTVLAIAHRLSTLRMMDRIIVMDKGAVAEDGTHDELLAKGGIYARLWKSQVGGFIQE